MAGKTEAQGGLLALLFFLCRTGLANFVYAAILVGCARLGVYLITAGYLWLGILWLAWTVLFFLELVTSE